MQLQRGGAEPAPPGQVVAPSRRDNRPEPGAVAEDPEMGELVDHDGLQGLRRRQDQAPAEHQPAATRRPSRAASETRSSNPSVVTIRETVDLPTATGLTRSRWSSPRNRTIAPSAIPPRAA